MEDSIVLTNAFFIELDEAYSQMFLRPYIVKNVNDKTAKAIGDAISNNMYGNKSMSASAVASDLGSFIGISERAGTAVVLPNGNNTKRYRFILDIICDAGSGIKNRYLIQGYTSHSGIAINHGVNAVFDPEMELYINSITEFFVKDVAGGYPVVTIGETYNTIQSLVNANNMQINDLVTARGMDIHQLISINEDDNMGDTLGNGFGSADLSDVGRISNVNTVTSARRNQDTSVFIANLLTSYQEGRTVSSISNTGFRNARSLALDNAVRQVMEPILGRNLFIKRLQSFYTSLNRTTFSVSDLERLFYTNFNHVVKVFQSSPAVIQERVKRRNDMGIIDPMEPSETYAADVLTSRALEFNNSVSSYMAESGLTESVIIIAAAPGVAPIVSVLSGKSLMGDPYVIPGTNKLENLLRVIALPKFMNGISVTSFRINIHADLLKDTVMNISVDDYSYEEFFKFPTFCDSTYLPVVMDKQQRSSLIQDIDWIYSEVETTSTDSRIMI